MMVYQIAGLAVVAIALIWASGRIERRRTQKHYTAQRSADSLDAFVASLPHSADSAVAKAVFSYLTDWSDGMYPPRAGDDIALDHGIVDEDYEDMLESLLAKSGRAAAADTRIEARTVADLVLAISRLSR